MTTPPDPRQAMRRILRDRRVAIPHEELAATSMAVLARLARVPVLEHAGLVAGYRAVRGEVDVDGVLTLLRERGATVTVPRVAGEAMTFLPWEPDAATSTGPFGITEPVDGTPVPFGDHDVVLVPLVAFDDRGHRLGQGGGYYDRAIAGTETQPVLIGVAHAFQQVTEVPVAAWDQPLDAAVTEEGLHVFRPGALDAPP